MKSRHPISLNDINDCLPQTQCGECGYQGCLPYAQAIYAQQAPLTLCPPGGTKTLSKLGQLLDRDVSAHMTEMAAKTRPPQIAEIDESQCIGCTKCIQACPVDAIFGASKQMHVVITHECTGCGLCVDPCPVNCISLHPVEKADYQALVARQRFDAKNARLLQEKQKKETLYHQKRLVAAQTETSQVERVAKNEYILAALQRTQKKHG